MEDNPKTLYVHTYACTDVNTHMHMNMEGKIKCGGTCGQGIGIQVQLLNGKGLE